MTWNDDRGYGFISSAGIPNNLFVHISAFSTGSPRPEVGDAVSFNVASSARGPQASTVKIIGLVSSSRAARIGQLDYLAIALFIPLALFIALSWAVPLAVFAIYLVASIFCFLAYGTDKRAATNGTWRTPESSLLFLGLLGGWPGAIVGMQVFRHKTRKASFRALFWVTVVVNIAAFIFLTSPQSQAMLAEFFRSVGS
jgi:uncharacterized membrane protein YsdA (DUF1294 family)/cold shock CspA family protein